MIFIEIIFLIFFLGVLFWQVSLIFSSIVGAPTVYSADKAVRDALRLAGLKEGDKIVDLGCGNAKSLIIAASEFGARGYGIDISPYCVLKSRFNIWKLGLNKKIKIDIGSIRKAESQIRSTDAIYLYLLHSMLKEHEDWLFQNIRPETRVVCLCFQFGKHKPQKIVDTVNLGRPTKIYLYQK